MSAKSVLVAAMGILWAACDPGRPEPVSRYTPPPNDPFAPAHVETPSLSNPEVQSVAKTEVPKKIVTPAQDEKGPKGRGSLAGKAVLLGEAPKMPPIKMTPECAEVHGGNPLRAEDVVAKKVDGDTRLRWVAVYISSPLAGSFEPRRDPVQIDQVGCRYMPHVVVKMMTQPLLVKNSDGFMHNVHLLPTTNREDNRSQKPNQVDVWPMDRPETAVLVKCDVHSWMKAHLVVVEHPFFATTGEDGTFEIKGVPAGEHELTFWHEKYGKVARRVSVEPDKTANVTGEFKP